MVFASPSRAALSHGPERYEDLLDHAEEVVVAIIDGQDKTAPASTAFTWIRAQVVKNLYGQISDREEIIYPQPKSLGSDLGVGDVRILFLVRAKPYYRPDHKWSLLSLPLHQTRFNIASSEVRGLDLLALREFLHGMDKSGAHPDQVDYSN